MMAWSVIGLLFLIIPLAIVLIALVGLIFLWVRVFKGTRRSGDMPTCGRCGYAVRGLAGLNCPECGSDLREVGISTPALRGSVSPLVFVLLWTVLLPVPGCLVSGILVAVGPKNHSSMGGSLTLSTPTSGEYQSLTINEFSGGFYGSGGMSMTSMMISGNNQQYESLDQIDPAAMTYVDYSNFVYTQQNQTPAPITLDRKAILDALKRAGADPTKQDVIDEADEVLSIIQTMPTLGLAGATSTRFSVNHTSHNYDQPAMWFILLVGLLGLGLWAFGMVFYFRVRSKQVPENRPFNRDPPRFAPPGPPPSAPSF